MASHLCCLVGFDAAGLGTVRGMAQLFDAKLSAEWAFQIEASASCDLLVCDIDSRAGAQAWRAAGHATCAIATSSVDVTGRLVLRKPFRGHGPDGLIHVLNEAARLRLEPIRVPEPASRAPAQPELVAPIARGWAMLLSMFRPASKRAAPAKPDPGPPPEPDAFAAATPVVEPVSFPPHKPPFVKRNAPMASALVEEYPVEGARHGASGGLVPYAPLSRLARVDAGAPEPVSESFGLATVPETIEADLLAALRRFRSLSQVAVIRFNDMPTICVVSATEMFYSLISLQGLYDAPRSSLTPARVSIARNSHHGRTEAQSYYQSGSQSYFVSMVGAPLKHLFWVAVLRCGDAGEVGRYMDASFHFRVWPDLVQLPHESHHVTWCGMLSRGPVTMAALAKATGHDLQTAAVFLAACDELGILDRKEPAYRAAPGVLALSYERSAERAGVVRSLMNRLGFSRP